MEKKTTGTKETTQKTESFYSVEELASCSKKVFGKEIRSECVIAAFRNAGKTSATTEEAKKIVLGFLSKEVD